MKYLPNDCRTNSTLLIDQMHVESPWGFRSYRRLTVHSNDEDSGKLTDNPIIF